MDQFLQFCKSQFAKARPSLWFFIGMVSMIWISAAFAHFYQAEFSIAAALTALGFLVLCIIHYVKEDDE